jgi:hypothetical protein
MKPDTGKPMTKLHADNAEREPCYALQGLPLLQKLDELNWSRARLVTTVMVVSVSIHSIAFFASGDFDGYQQAVDITGKSGYFGLFAANAVLTAIYTLAMVLLHRHMQESLRQGLGAIDTKVLRYLSELRPSGIVVVITTLLFLIFGMVLVQIVLLVPLEYSYRNPVALFHGSKGLFTYAYILTPPAAYLSAQLLPPMFAFEKILRLVATEIRVDIFKAEEYSVIATPAVIVFSVVCIITGIPLVAVTLAGGTFQEQSVPFILLMFMLSMIGVSTISYQTVLLRNRFADQIRLERLATIARIDDREVKGESAVLSTLRIGNLSSKAELIAYLALLDTLPEWPIGPHLQKIFLFGLLPPIAWSLAAMVENTLY